jgi:hypothetical protein
MPRYTYCISTDCVVCIWISSLDLVSSCKRTCISDDLPMRCDTREHLLMFPYDCHHRGNIPCDVRVQYMEIFRIYCGVILLIVSPSGDMTQNTIYNESKSHRSVLYMVSVYCWDPRHMLNNITIKLNKYCFRPPLCTRVMLNWAN